MIIKKKNVEFLAFIFFISVVAVVFQQIFTSLTEQGIATGGPYDNAAAYPRAIAALIATLVAVQFLIVMFFDARIDTESNTNKGNSPERLMKVASLIRPFFLLLIFAVYLGMLQYFGYHLTTPPMVIAIMLLCGMRAYITIVVTAVAISLVLAFLFENFLNVVLPGGILHLNIPW